MIAPRDWSALRQPPREGHFAFERWLEPLDQFANVEPFSLAVHDAAVVPGTDNESLVRLDHAAEQRILIRLAIGDVDHRRFTCKLLLRGLNASKPPLGLFVLPLRRLGARDLALTPRPLAAPNRLTVNHPERPPPISGVHQQGEVQQKAGLSGRQVPDGFRFCVRKAARRRVVDRKNDVPTGGAFGDSGRMPLEELVERNVVVVEEPICPF